MPAVSSPFGLKAKHSPSGIVRPQRYVIPANQITNPTTGSAPSNIYQDDAVYIDANGFIQISSASATGNFKNACIGSFQGVEFNDSNGRRTVSNQFIKSAVNGTSTANTGLGTTDVWFWIYTDPNLVYEIQLGAAGIGPGGGAQATMGNLIAWNEGTGQNAVTGFSTGYGTIGGTAPGAANDGSFIVYNLAYDNNPQNTYAPGTPTGINTNGWTDAYPNVLVRLATPQFNGALPGF